jgi:hypothetical protein
MNTYQQILRQDFVKELSITPLNQETYKDFFSKDINEFICKYPYSRILYLENEASTVIHHAHSYLPLKSGTDSFNRMLFRLPHINFQSLLFALTVYPHAGNNYTIKKNQKRPTEVDLFKEVTQSSYGWLVYGHQLEMVYSCLTGCDLEEANEFRKGWNKKDQTIRNAASTIYISAGYSLANYIEDYAFDENRFCYNANFKGAFLLWQALNGCYAGHKL